MGKKVIALGLALVLLCGMLAGCGAQKKETAAASGGNVIKVGFAGPLSGASGQVGASCYNGALMAFNERKAELEEKSGCTLEFVTNDDQSDPTVAVTIGQKMVSDPDVLIMIGEKVHDADGVGRVERGALRDVADAELFLAAVGGVERDLALVFPLAEDGTDERGFARAVRSN